MSKPLEATVVATYNPAYLLNINNGRVSVKSNTNAAVSVRDHLQILSDRLAGVSPTSHIPSHVPLRAPRASDPRVGSIDIETYGACKLDGQGRPLPEQTCFDPWRSSIIDAPPLGSTILSCSITLIHTDPSLPSPDRLSQARIGETFFFRLDRARDRRLLKRWLSHLTEWWGMNLPFDVSFLASEGYVPSPSPLLLDLAVCNYLHSEVRPERSLKTIGPVLGAYTYDDVQTIKHERFADPTVPAFRDYNCGDTVHTAIGVITLAKRIQSDFPSTAKLSPACVSFYNDILWTCIDLTRSGVPVSPSRLRRLEGRLRRRIKGALESAISEHGLIIAGKGSEKSVLSLFYACVAEIDAHRHDDSSILDDRRVQKTDKKKQLSRSDHNASLFLEELPPSSPLRDQLAVLSAYKKADKLLGTYLYPLLYHQRKKPINRKSLAVPAAPPPDWRPPLTPEENEKIAKGALPPRPDQPLHDRPLILHPTWFPVPSQFDSGDEGGTEQGRITCKNPAVQTFPSAIKNCITSRFPGGFLIWMDLSQIELRVAALISGEPSLIDAYTRGADLHGERACSLFGPAIRDDPRFKKVFRQCGKMVNFADLFRATAATMRTNVITQVGETLDYAIFEQAVLSRPTLRPVLYEWQERLIEDACRDHIVELPITGQSRYFIGSPSTIRELYIPTIVNFPVQSQAANLMLAIQSDVRRRLSLRRRNRALLCCNVYDSILIDTPARDLPYALDALLTSLSTLHSITYPSSLFDYYNRSLPIGYEVEVFDADGRNTTPAHLPCNDGSTYVGEWRLAT